MGYVSLPDFGADPVTVTGPLLDGKVNPLATEFNGGIENVNIKSTAGIVYTKLNLTGSIVNTDISLSAAIVDTKLATISTANKVSGAAIGSLSSLPSAAGIIPIANLASGTPTGSKFIRDDGTLQTTTPTASTSLSGSVIQSVYTQDASKVSGTNTIPFTSAAVTTSQGTAYTALATSITPNNASNILVIEILINITHSAGQNSVVALMQDTGVNALISIVSAGSASLSGTQGILRYKMLAGTTASTTFKCYYGPVTGGTSYVNSDTTGGTLFNSLFFSSMRITEIKA